jgi:hypothetical protein
MTSHDDRVDEVDDVPELSAADEAFVRGLLAELPAVTVPADLADRLDAALLAARDEPAADAEDTPLAETDEPGEDDRTEDEPAVAATTGTTVVALDEARVRRNARRTRVLQVAAVSVLAIAGVAGIAKIAGSGRVASTSTAAGSGASAVPSVEQALLTHSGHTYTDATLISDVRTLAAHEMPAAGGGTYGVTTPPAGGGSLTASPTEPTPSQTADSGQPSTDKAQAISRSGLVACLAAVEEGLPDPVTPVAVDQGSYRGQVALVVVLPGAIDPTTSYDVFVVGIACGQNADAHLLTYQLVEAH